MMLLQALNPFYIFQLFSCALWFGDEYYYYASCIIIVSCVSLTVQIYQTRSVIIRNLLFSWSTLPCHVVFLLYLNGVLLMFELFTISCRPVIETVCS